MISKYDGLNKNLYDTSIPIRIQMKNQNETYNEGGRDIDVSTNLNMEWEK